MTITGVITALVIGAVIGALARLILPGRQNIPVWLTVVVGIVAALLGTFIARARRYPDRHPRHRLVGAPRPAGPRGHRRRDRGRCLQAKGRPH